MATNQRNRNWMFTINYKDKEPIPDEDIKVQLEKMNVKYAIFKLERGENGTLHHQGYFTFENARSFNAVQKPIHKAFGKGHLEPRRGNHNQAKQYIQKEETAAGPIVEFGTEPKTNQGKRTDLVILDEMLSDGFHYEEVLDMFPKYRYNYGDRIKKRYYELIYKDFKAKPRANLEVYYIGDKSGIGKTTWINYLYGYEGVYTVGSYTSGSFDNYEAHEVLMLDEFRSDISLRQMLTYIDIHPAQLSARYSNKWACYNKVFIVSNWPFERQYETIYDKNLDRIMRRKGAGFRTEELEKEATLKTEQDLSAWRRRFNNGATGTLSEVMFYFYSKNKNHNIEDYIDYCEDRDIPVDESIYEVARKLKGNLTDKTVNRDLYTPNLES